MENVGIPFVCNVRESLGATKLVKTELPRTSSNILAREDVLVFQGAEANGALNSGKLNPCMS